MLSLRSLFLIRSLGFRLEELHKIAAIVFLHVKPWENTKAIYSKDKKDDWPIWGQEKVSHASGFICKQLFVHTCIMSSSPKTIPLRWPIKKIDLTGKQ